MGYYDYNNLAKVSVQMIGRKFNHLTVIGRSADWVDNAGKHYATWDCECDCDNHTIVKNVKGILLRDGKVGSCGCAHYKRGKDHASYTHGLSKLKLYKKYYTIISRCENPNHCDYNRYGAKGIKMCPEWRNDFTSFARWCYSLGYTEENSDRYTVERIDLNGDYSPDNCILVDRKSQCNNKSNNHFITFNGKTQTLTQWAEETGIPASTIYSRLIWHWPVEKIFTTEKKSAKLYTMNGESHSLYDWSKIYSVEYTRLANFIRKGFPIEKAIFYAKNGSKGDRRSIYVFFNNSTVQMGAAAKVLGLEWNTVNSRFQNLKDRDKLESIFKRPSSGRPINAIYFEENGKLYTESEWENH